MIAIVLSPPLNGLLGISESLENALAWSGDRDLAGYCVIVGTDLRSGSDAECCHASPLPFVMVCGGLLHPDEAGACFSAALANNRSLDSVSSATNDCSARDDNLFHFLFCWFP